MDSIFVYFDSGIKYSESIESVAIFIVLLYEVLVFVTGSIVVAWSIIFTRGELYGISKLRIAGSYRATQGLSVIMSSHNSADGILQTVYSLKEQSIKRLQIIVVNDGSNDHTDQVCRQLRKNGMIENYIKIESRSGKAAAFNAGLSVAKYPHVALCDTGTTFHYDCMEIALGYFHDPMVAAVSANIGVRNFDASLLAYLQKVEYVYLGIVYRNFYNLFGVIYCMPGALGICKTDLLKSLGGLPPGTGEDLELSIMLRNLGWKIEFSLYSIALTDVPVTLGSFIKQRVRWDRNTMQLLGKSIIYYALNPTLKKFKFIFSIGFIDIIATEIFRVFFYWSIVAAFSQAGMDFILHLFVAYSATVVLKFVNYVFIILVKSKHDRDWNMLLYVPLLQLYNVILGSGIRTWALYSEIFARSSLKDPFVPKKVQQEIGKIR